MAESLPDGATLVVSRGVGMGEAPFRAFAPADVVVCRLRSPAMQADCA